MKTLFYVFSAMCLTLLLGLVAIATGSMSSLLLMLMPMSGMTDIAIAMNPPAIWSLVLMATLLGIGIALCIIVAERLFPENARMAA